MMMNSLLWWIKFIDTHRSWKETGAGKEKLESLKEKINDREPGRITKVF